MTLVEWTKPNLFTVMKPKMVKPFLRLKPGINEVDPKVWTEAAKNKNVQHYLDEDEIIVHDSPTGAGAKKSGLAGYDEKAARRMIRSTYDPELLGKWKASEKREKVLAEIAKQVEKIDKAVPEKTADEKAEGNFEYAE